VADGPQRLTIRLACIDAPETGQAPYGAASREQLQQLLPVGSAVNLKIQTKDRYGRTVVGVLRELTRWRTRRFHPHLGGTADHRLEPAASAALNATNQAYSHVSTGGRERPKAFLDTVQAPRSFS